MSAAIKAKLDAKFPIASGGSTYRQDMADCVAEAVVEYLVANNIVNHAMGPGKLA